MISNGTFVPYILGVPSVRAEVLGLVGDYYVLLQEYDTIDEGGNKIHVKKEYYREKTYVEMYWCDITTDRAGHGHKGIITVL